ncbi:MAG: DUF3035 domain-containing protein [Alphaproteobacteria bacterium]|nr:DUF3035 domain-containing protein [Alphaproteobacteria bacterium]
MIGQILKVLGLAGAMAALGACGIMDSIGGNRKVSPDEFKVVSHTPLTMPPNADLRPPRPGAPRPGDQTPQAQARAVLAPAPTATAGRGGAARPAPAPVASTGSPAETQLLARAGGGSGGSDIRTQLNRESRILADSDRSLIDALIFWQDTPPPGVILDPVREQARLRAAQAQGTDPGGATPQIERRKRGIFEGIF